MAVLTVQEDWENCWLEGSSSIERLLVRVEHVVDCVCRSLVFVKSLGTADLAIRSRG